MQIRKRNFAKTLEKMGRVSETKKMCSYVTEKNEKENRLAALGNVQERNTHTHTHTHTMHVMICVNFAHLCLLGMFVFFLLSLEDRSQQADHDLHLDILTAILDTL